MGENIPPPDNTRGVPYYEKLKRDLRETLQKKRQLDKNMVSTHPNPIPPSPNIYKSFLTVPFLPSPLSKTKSSATKPRTWKRPVPAT